MIWTELHWVDGPWSGKLALAARPRGGEWLHDELESWRRAGVHTVFSRLTPEEERDLDLLDEQREDTAWRLSPSRFLTAKELGAAALLLHACSSQKDSKQGRL